MQGNEFGTQNTETYLHSISLAAPLAPERRSAPSRERRTQNAEADQATNAEAETQNAEVI